MRLTYSAAPSIEVDRLAGAAFADPDAGLDRLYEIASRDQWTVAGLDWSAIELEAFPLPLREAASDVFAQLHHGELTAMMCASRMMDRLPAGAARLVCATQVSDEARHVRFFANVLGRLGCEGRVRDSVVTLMHSVYEAGTPEAMMLGMQILIEGVAHSFFHEGARLFAEIKVDGPPFDAARTLIVDWLPKLLARDESRHIAFGLHYLRERLPDLHRSERHKLEAQVEVWGAMVHNMAIDPDNIDALGVDGLRFSSRCIEDINLRLDQIGMHTRLETLR